MAAPVRVVATTDGPQITVSALLKDPLTIPTLVLSDVNQMFIADQLLRQAGTPSGGVIRYFESSPLFADQATEYVEEYGEIPVGTTSLGVPRGARTRKRALGVVISQEMLDRNNVDKLNTDIRLVRNTLIRDWDQTFMSAILGAATNTLASTAAWAGPTAKIRLDVLRAVKLITDTRRGYVPDTLAINPSSRIDLMASAEIQQIFVGAIAGQNPMYSGALNFDFAGLSVMQSYQVPTGTAIVCQAKTIGGYADERPLQATPVYRDNKTETWRCDVLRTSASFIDQPLAATILTGV